MSQAKRLEALNAFKSGNCKILLCNDLASRGLDIPAVDTVINYDIPDDPRDYMHHVGQAAPTGVAISFVSPNEARWFEMIETHIGKKLPVYQAQIEEVLRFSNRVSVAKRLADEEMNNSGWRSGGYLGEEDVRKIESAFSSNHGKVFYISPEVLEKLKQQQKEIISATENSESSADGIETNDGVAHNVERVLRCRF
ncbi:DEAD-box ATP-dependent RNA helicase 10 isoform X3 [Medicago truncatula]|uniref:DEAD-box ATP-dependent RNA helicase 10 isoform X3 n=1 Tax=Medicago truncatula TaxID=3880 RepID=UPI001967F1AB|nr:DEAD-box ATP-dependent RNA helicase 10 isoform X3 [Medicago truncatula]XP_024631160.2 DEAD-box ATP-dependent RNA helicase 10 isoform X3 [Medicago truncatula]XP_024631161.2 DEAD-box ATP-dependent RNA helicase 10 isoform X3 [Medicago truncatula]XP_024631162.2 DEAD-box ATP-dependent RNA helicase 10 isoform X3 [Medicago truncatula]